MRERVVKTIKIGKREVGHYLQPFIVAEIGVNHEGSMTLAKKLIDQAVGGGAHAAKFQTYKAEMLASKYSPAYWDTEKEPMANQFELFKKYDSFDPADYEELASYCDTKGVEFMSTPFDLNAVDFLEPLVPAFKIASADITNVPLLRKAARAGKPMLISTGAASLPEIELAVETVKNAGCTELILLHCVLNYPTPVERAQLGMISVLKRVFPECLIGYSDHVVSDETISALEAAALLGACVLEKHFTYNKNLPGNDHYHAMDKQDLKGFVTKLGKYQKLVKAEGKDITMESSARLHARRSIVAATNIKRGDLLNQNNLTVKRPGHGISPVYWDEILGRKAHKDIQEDQLLKWDDIK
jgi:N-acetylneuraminate synthase